MALMKLNFDSHIGLKYDFLMDGINPECLTISNNFFRLLNAAYSLRT